MKLFGAYFSLLLIAASFIHTMDVRVGKLNRFEDQNSKRKIITYIANVSIDSREYLVTIEKKMSITGNPLFNKARWKGFRCFKSQTAEGDWYTIHDELPFDTTITLFNILSGIEITRQWKIEHPNAK